MLRIRPSMASRRRRLNKKCGLEGYGSLVGEKEVLKSV